MKGRGEDRGTEERVKRGRKGREGTKGGREVE